MRYERKTGNMMEDIQFRKVPPLMWVFLIGFSPTVTVWLWFGLSEVAPLTGGVIFVSSLFIWAIGITCYGVFGKR